MSLSSEAKSKIVADYARGDNDTGSPEVQVALLSARISELTEHFGEHQEAKKHFEEALRIDAKHAEAHSNLAILLKRHFPDAAS